MSEMIKPPFTDDQIASLNAYQTHGYFHPFTCGNDDCPGELVHLCVSGDESPILEIHTSCNLVASIEGWSCPTCGYKQYWAWDWMADWSWPGAEEYALALLANGY